MTISFVAQNTAGVSSENRPKMACPVPESKPTVNAAGVPQFI